VFKQALLLAMLVEGGSHFLLDESAEGVSDGSLCEVFTPHNDAQLSAPLHAGHSFLLAPRTSDRGMSS